MAINSREKGRRGEQDVVKMFRSVWGGHWSRRGIGVAGDVILTPPDFPFSIEVKNEADTTLNHCFMDRPSTLIKHYAQAAKQSGDRIPLLVFKCDRKWYCAIGEQLPSFLAVDRYLTCHWADDRMFVLLLDDLLNAIER